MDANIVIVVALCVGFLIWGCSMGKARELDYGPDLDEWYSREEIERRRLHGED